MQIIVKRWLKMEDADKKKQKFVKELLREALAKNAHNVVLFFAVLLIIMLFYFEFQTTDIIQKILGFYLSLVGGAIVLQILINDTAWPYMKHIKAEEGVFIESKTHLTLWLGVTERTLYIIALILVVPEFIALWLAMKVATQWGRWTGKDEEPYNIFLIGNALSILFALLGTWIALGGNLPSFRRTC